MIRLLCFCCIVFYLLPLPVKAQQSQETKIEPVIPIGPSTQRALDLALVEQLVVERTNAFRREHKQPPLRLNSDLETAAASFADYMAAHDKYGHTADGHEPWERARLAGYDYCTGSENIAFAAVPADFKPEQLADVFIHGWENSPEHQENLLDPDVVEFGVAISHDKKTGKYYAVQDFGRPKSMAYHFTIGNDTDAEIPYRVDDKEFKLPPHYRMVHECCRQALVAVTIKDRDGNERVEKLKPSKEQTFTFRDSESGPPMISND